jgi:hypothetical protein
MRNLLSPALSPFVPQEERGKIIQDWLPTGLKPRC